MRHLSIPLLALIIISCSPSEQKELDQKEAEQTKEAVAETKVKAEISTATRHKTLPDFTQYTDVKEKKKAFFDFLRPMVKEENDRIRQEREKLESIFSNLSKSGTILYEDSIWVASIAEQMRMKKFDAMNENHRTALLRKKDIVPVSLFLAQAANESSWGTSRFATQANNLFGQWCFTPGCGIVPAQRAANETHEVRKFETVNAAVNSYVRNINSNNAYKELRAMREDLRKQGKIPDGQSLAKGLTRYSARGEEYVKEIQAIIRVNKLEELS